MTTDHLVKVPQDVLQRIIDTPVGVVDTIHLAYAAGADAQLELDAQWLEDARNHGFGYDYGKELAHRIRATQRPKSSSLKEQAQRILVENGTTSDGRLELDGADLWVIQAALAQLPD